MAEEQSSEIRSPRALLVHHDAHPLALRLFLNREYTDDWIDWDHQALWDQLRHDFGPTLSELSQTKLQAVRTLETETLFWSEWHIFGPTVMSFNNRIPNFWLVQRPTAGQLWAAVDIASSIDSREYSDDVGKFVAACLLDHGITWAPFPLDFAQPYLDYPHPRSTPEVRKRIENVLDGEYDVLEETEADIQAAKLVVAKNYIEFRRRQLLDQLEMLKNAQLDRVSS